MNVDKGNNTLNYIFGAFILLSAVKISSDLFLRYKKSKETAKESYNDLLVSMRGLFDTSAPKPTDKQIEKYLELAQTITEEQFKILNFSRLPKSSKEILENGLNLKKHTDNFNRHIAPLLENNTLKRTLPNVPKSRFQKYFTTNVGTIIHYIIENKIV